MQSMGDRAQVAANSLWQSGDALVGKRPELMTAVAGATLHAAVVEPFCRLRERAAAAGFDLRIASGFRGFERQLAIWNAKALGQRSLLDSRGQPVNFSSLSQRQLIHVILRWSALPGASRHHWGTDMDVYDGAAVSSDYRVQLTPSEVEGHGPFAPLHRWLDEQFRGGNAEDFFRPYGCDRGGVAPERWHLSYAPLAARCQAALMPSLLAQAWRNEELALKEVLLAQLPSLYHRYVVVPAEAYPKVFQRYLKANGG